MYSEPVRRAAMEQARDSGAASISAKVKLVQENDKNVQSGFLMYLPIYRNAAPRGTVQERRGSILGWVYSPFRMNDLAHGMYGDRATDLDIEIYDGEVASPDNLMYDSVVENQQGQNLLPLSKTLHLKVAGHTWTLLITSLPQLEARVDFGKSTQVASVGIAISLLFTLLAWLLVNGRRRAVAYARQMNQELIAQKQAVHDSEEKLQAILNYSEVAIAWYNEAGVLEYRNPKFFSLFGYTQEEVNTLEQWYSHAYPDADYRARMVAEWNQKVANSLPHKGAIEPMEVAVHCKDGSTRYVLLMGSWAGARLLANFSDITKRKLAEESLKASQEKIEHILDELRYQKFALDQHAIVATTDVHGTITYANDKFCELSGYAHQELLGKNHRMLNSGKHPSTFFKDMFSTISAGKVWHGEVCNRAKTGHLYWVMTTIVPFMNEAGEPIQYIAIRADITERKLSEEIIQKSEASLRAILDNVPYLIWLKDKYGRFIAVNQAFFKTTGLAKMQDVLGKTDLDLWPEHLARKYRADDAEVLSTRKQKLTEEQSMDNGEVHWLETFKAPIMDSEGKLLGTTGFAQDITERKNAEGKVYYFAHYDMLTDLPNRRLFSDRLQQAFVKAKRDHIHIALMFIDLDKFKPINDELGHQVGDLLLKAVAHRMHDCVRESDTVARIGGDEFVVLLPEIEAVHGAWLVAEKIREALNQTFDLEGHCLSISSSTGIAVYPEHGVDEKQLVRNADTAMYHAKEGGRNKVVLYQTDMLTDT